MPKPVPKRILVIDDDADYRQLLGRFLRKAFPEAEVHQYDPVASGKPPQSFDWSRFDVLILDFRLGPKENGLDWLRHFKRDSASFPATILLTAAGSEELAMNALRHGAHDYLRKQKVDARTLKKSIGDAFNTRARHSNVEASLTLTASRFSKSFFYSRFELAFNEAEKGENRALALVRTDGFDALKESLGLISVDKITRHIAALGLEQFKVESHVPRATLFGDSSIAFIVGGYAKKDDLQTVLVSLQERIKNTPPIINNQNVPVTVSIGGVVIANRMEGIERLFEQAESALKQASGGAGQGIVVLSGQDRGAPALDTNERSSVFDAAAAVRENRIMALFQPLMAVSENSGKLRLAEFFEIGASFVARNGDSLPVDSVLAKQPDSKISRLLDRWKIRECVGRARSRLESKRHGQGFLISLGAPSFDDPKLAGWIGDLVKFHGGNRRLDEICIGISPDILMRDTGNAFALCTELRENHGFRFVLDGIDDPALCRACFARMPCDLIALSAKLAGQIIDQGRGTDKSDALLSFDTKRGALSLVRGVEDADGLHAIIAAGVDFAQGEFVAPVQEEIDAAEESEAAAG